MNSHLVLIGFVSLCIGLPTYFMGCNQKIHNTCFAYNKFHGVVFKNNDLYSNGYNNDNNGKYHNDASSGYIYAINKNTTETCVINVSSYKDEYQQSANYPIGTHVNWLKQKNTNYCYRSAYGNWVTGIVFLSIAGLSLLIIIFIEFYQCLNKKHNYLPTQIEHNNNDVINL